GDEQGFVGDGNDKDASQSMFASQVPSYLDDDLIDGTPYGDGDHFSTDAQLYPLISELAQLLSSTPALGPSAQVEAHAADDMVRACTRSPGWTVRRRSSTWWR